MRIQHVHNLPLRRTQYNEHGMAVIVVMALFAIMMIFLGISVRSLNYLRQDLKIIERQQLQRTRRATGLANLTITTNAPQSVALSATNSSPRFNHL